VNVADSNGPGEDGVLQGLTTNDLQTLDVSTGLTTSVSGSVTATLPVQAR
jgi:hypothetical protein